MALLDRSRWRAALALLAAVACGFPDGSPPGPGPTVAPSRSPPPAALPGEFVDVAAASGLDVRNVCGAADKPYIVDAIGAGACWLDYDRDGWLDLYVVQGSDHERRGTDRSPGDVLYRGRGDGTFEDVTAAAGVRQTGWGGGCAIGDVDNDGWPDVYVLNHGANALLHNQGDGSFRDVTVGAGVGDERWGVSGAFADFDRDGDLDLYVANYVEYDWDEPMVDGGKNFCTWRGLKVFCGPRGLRLSYPVYYRNAGDGRFVDATAESGIGKGPPTFGLGVVVIDYDRDGWPDLYTANDARPNHLWHNRGDGTFEEVAFRTAAGLSDRGKEQAGMGVDAGDYDDDGWIDIFVTNFSEDSYTLYRNEGGFFTDVSHSTGITLATFVPLGWGASFFDFDDDGDLDLAAINGHVYPQVEEVDTQPKISWKQAPNLLENRAGRYHDVTVERGLGEPLTGRGSAVADHDNDGDLDLLIINLDDSPALYRNPGAGRHWLGVELVGTDSNRDAIGAVLTVRGADLREQRRQAVPSGSYSSSKDPRVHFGLGQATRADLTIEWPSGQVSEHRDLEVDRYVRIVEAPGQTIN